VKRRNDTVTRSRALFTLSPKRIF